MAAYQPFLEPIDFQFNSINLSAIGFQPLKNNLFSIFTKQRTAPYVVNTIPQELVDAIPLDHVVQDLNSEKNAKSIRRKAFEDKRLMVIAEFPIESTFDQQLMKIAAETSNTSFRISIDGNDFQWSGYIIKSKFLYKGSLPDVFRALIHEIMSNRIPADNRQVKFPKPYKY